MISNVHKTGPSELPLGGVGSVLPGEDDRRVEALASLLRERSISAADSGKETRGVMEGDCGMICNPSSMVSRRSATSRI